MTAPNTPNGGTRTDRQRRRRRIALAAILALIAITALLTPELTGARLGDERLTTYSTEPEGARLLYELAARLGWRVERTTDDSVVADAGTAIAILSPSVPLAATETHAVLERVRAGSGLLYVMDQGSPLQDSLHLKRLGGGPYVAAQAGSIDAPREARASDTLKARRFDTTDADTTSDDEEAASAECSGKSRNGGALALWPDQTVRLYRLSWTRPRPPDVVVFARATGEGGERDSSVARPAAIGFPLGRGRVVVVSDPDQLRNDVLRVCRWGLDVVAVRMLEYLSHDGPTMRDRLVFDEYHQGFGAHPGTVGAIALYLSRTPSGHLLLQCLLGGLVLLLALGTRLVPARDPERVERRSPLEHVGALARAYLRVGATRTATARLLHGVRRRLGRSPRIARSDASDLAFLDDASRMAPDLRDDIALIRRAMDTPVAPRELESVGRALSRLEETLQTQRR